MADENRYPRPYWNPLLPIEDGVNPVYAHSKGEEEGLRARSWTDVFANYPKNDHHRRLYKPDGSSVVCFSADQEKALTEQGYGRTPVVITESVKPVAEPPTLVAKDAKRIDALEEQVREIATGQSAILELLAELKEEKQSKKKAS